MFFLIIPSASPFRPVEMSCMRNCISSVIKEIPVLTVLISVNCFIHFKPSVPNGFYWEILLKKKVWSRFRNFFWTFWTNAARKSQSYSTPVGYGVLMSRSPPTT